MFEDVSDDFLRDKLLGTYQALEKLQCHDELLRKPPYTFRLAWECESRELGHDEFTWDFCIEYLISFISNGQYKSS